MKPGGRNSPEKPYELVTICARRRSTTWLSAASRSWKLFGAPTYTMSPPGAIVWTASMSSVSSPYQPCGSCGADSGCLKVPGATTCVNCPGRRVGSPWRVEYSLTSLAMVGDAYASMTATVWPEPSKPEPVTPYAPRSCAGVAPQGAYGCLEPWKTGLSVAICSPQKLEHGGALRKPAEGGASAPTRSVWTRLAL